MTNEDAHLQLKQCVASLLGMKTGSRSGKYLTVFFKNKNVFKSACTNKHCCNPFQEVRYLLLDLNPKVPIKVPPKKSF